ncbi:T9SS type A sorting domain-containing protein [candidate division KSB1 bacterium]|nr:T9SS type A sorting domain-containing protein [candidate division KSB1 bacterium]
MPEPAVSHRRTVPTHRNTNGVEGNNLLVFNEIMSAVASGLRQAQASVLNINSLAVGGYTSYNNMSSDFTPPVGGPSPQPEHNITKALTYKPWGIIINLPSNDASGNYTIDEQVFNMKSVTQMATDAEIPVWVTTTQPRNFSETQRENLMAMRDSILSIYGDHAINVFDPLAYEDGTIKGVYNSGDGVHLNNAGHKVIFEKVVEAEVWESFTTGINHEVQEIPTSFALSSNYPNPFNPGTNIEYDLPQNANVKLVIYDLLGREIATIQSGMQQAGRHRIFWNATNVSSGMYFYYLTAYVSGQVVYRQSQKMMLVK